MRAFATVPTWAILRELQAPPGVAGAGCVENPVGEMKLRDISLKTALVLLAIAELAAAGVAANQVPFPYAVDDHQTANGNYLADNGAAMLIQQRELTPEKLAAVLQDLCSDRAKFRQMSMASRELAKPHATAQVAAICAAYAGYDFDNKTLSDNKAGQ